MEELGYFAHNYSGDVEANYELCAARTAKLIASGYLIYSPIIHSHRLDKLLRWTWRQWLDYDKRLIERCDFDYIVLPPAWQTSKGCCEEKRIFEQNGKKILHYTEII